MQTAPPNCGLLFFEKLHGSIEDKFPCRYFWGRVKNKNQTIWVYSEKFAFQILNFFKMSISEPVFFLQTHIQLFMRYLQQFQYLTTHFFCIDPKYRTPTTNILEYIVPLLYLPVFTIWVSAAKQVSHTLKLFSVWVSAAKQASHTLKLFIVWVSATKQASHTLKLFSVWVSAVKQASHTLKLFIVWVSATKQASHTLKLFSVWVSAAK